jgi:hypothetical protein
MGQACYKFTRYVLLWIVVPHILLHYAGAFLMRKINAPKEEKLPPAHPAPVDPPTKETRETRVTQSHKQRSAPQTSRTPRDELAMWEEAKFQTSRTDFLATCATATLDELRFRKDRILMFQKFACKKGQCKPRDVESIEQRLALQLLAVNNWINLRKQSGYLLEQAPTPSTPEPHLHASREDYELFCKFVKFRQQRASRMQEL